MEIIQPTRIQRKRSKGWKAPAGAVFVGRPTKWGNPFVVGKDVDNHADAVAWYRRWLTDTPAGRQCTAAARTELRGKNLMCWCAESEPCHADVLIEIANSQ